jgi:hypothetical protein
VEYQAIKPRMTAGYDDDSFVADLDHNGDSQKHGLFMLAFIDDLRAFGKEAA